MSSSHSAYKQSNFPAQTLYYPSSLPDCRTCTCCYQLLQEGCLLPSPFLCSIQTFSLSDLSSPALPLSSFPPSSMHYLYLCMQCAKLRPFVRLFPSPSSFIHLDILMSSNTVRRRAYAFLIYLFPIHEITVRLSECLRRARVSNLKD